MRITKNSRIFAENKNKRPEKTIFAFIETDEGDKFSKEQIKSLDKVGIMVNKNGGKYFKSLDEVAFYLNFKEKEIK